MLILTRLSYHRDTPISLLILFGPDSDALVFSSRFSARSPDPMVSLLSDETLEITW